MIGVVIPAHNEEAVIGRCVQSVIAAASHERLAGEQVMVIVVLDDCSDGTAWILEHYNVQRLAISSRNVGLARAVGADALLEQGARWLAFTDADSVVPEHWLVSQLGFDADAVCGIVNVEDWSAHNDAVRAKYDECYDPSDGHRHIHGANLGVSSLAYRRVGGFKPLQSHEDVRLVRDLETAGAHIIWTASNCVTTSARLNYRCKEGFGNYLHSLTDSPALVS